MLPILAMAALALAFFQRVPSFFKEHTEGDEVVYVALAAEMGWDLSHYTTKDDPRVSRHPYSIVRQPLFHHPPLYALVLKTGDELFSAPVAFGLLFGNAVLLLTFYYAYRWLQLIDASPATSAVVFAGLTICPLLLFSTSRVAHDGILGMLLACAVVSLIISLERPSILRATVAGLLWVLALNTRYTALAMLPLLPMIQIYSFYRRSPQSPGHSGDVARPAMHSVWTSIAIVWGLVLTLGLQHYMRILSTYGSLLPSDFITLEGNEFSPFVRGLAERTRLGAVGSLLAIYPIGLALATPAAYRALWRSGLDHDWPPVMAVVGVYCLAVLLLFSFQQVRYFAVATPCLYLALPLLFEPRLIGRFWPWSLALGAASLMLMVTTGFLNAVLAPPGLADVAASLFYFVPPLGRLT